MSKLNPSKTILIFKNLNDDDSNFEGLVTKNTSKNDTIFLLFNSVENSEKAQQALINRAKANSLATAASL